MLLEVEHDLIEVTLTPTQADRVAATLRYALALALDRVELGAAPCRTDVEEARHLLDRYSWQLEMLQWGEPHGDVQTHWSSAELRFLIQDLRDAAEECRAAGAHRDTWELCMTACALAQALDGRRPQSHRAPSGD